MTTTKVVPLRASYAIASAIVDEMKSLLFGDSRPPSCGKVVGHDSQFDHGPRDCVLVIDASPSMDSEDWPPSRLSAAKNAAHAFVDRLSSEEPHARVAIVAYATKAAILLGLTRVTNKRRVFEAIDRIRTRDFTNITAGLRKAARLLEGANRACQVVLLTDGCQNTGPQPYKRAARLRDRAIIECVGIGQRDEVDENLLREIASSYPDGRKRYRWIGDSQQLVQHFHNLAGRLSRSA
jgi:uncharacterized protein YegL